MSLKKATAQTSTPVDLLQSEIDQIRDKLNIVSSIKTISLLDDDSLTEIANALNVDTASYYENPASSLLKVILINGSTFDPIRTSYYKYINVKSGIYGFQDTQFTTNNFQLIYRLSTTADDVENDPDTEVIDFGNLGTTEVLDAINASTTAIEVNAPSTNLTVFKGIVNGSQESYLYIGSGGVYGASWTTMLANELELLEQEARELESVIAYNSIKFIENNDFPTYTMVDEFELLRENLDKVYFLVRNDVSIDFTNCRVKLLENNKATDLTSPDLEQSNYKAYLVNTGLYSDILVGGETYHFTFWRKKFKWIKKTISSSTYTILASDVDKFLEFTVACTVVLPNGLVADLEFQGEQVGTGDVEFVAETGGTLNQFAEFSNFTAGQYSVFGIRTKGSDVASLYGTLRLA